MLMGAHCITIQLIRAILFDDSPRCGRDIGLTSLWSSGAAYAARASAGMAMYFGSVGFHLQEHRLVIELTRFGN